MKQNWKSTKKEEQRHEPHSMEMTHDKDVTQSDKEVTQAHRTCPCGFLPTRYMVAMLSFLGFANIYAMRVNLSIAIAVMVANQTVIQDDKEIQVLSNLYCPACFLKLGVFLRIKGLLHFIQNMRFSLQ